MFGGSGPGETATVIRRHPASGERHMDLLVWGLLPHDTIDPMSAPRPTHARAETVVGKPMFVEQPALISALPAFWPNFAANISHRRLTIGSTLRWNMQRLLLSLGTKTTTLILALALMAAVFSGTQGNAQDKGDTPYAANAKSLNFRDIFASEPGDQRAYVLLGGGFIRGLRFGDPAVLISAWLVKHPNASITPISRMLMTNRRSLKQSEMVYIWVEDGDRSLNLDMVRAGMYPAAAMYDMVDNLAGLDRLLQDPKLADARAQTEKDRAAFPQDRTERLVAGGKYKEGMRRIEEAEGQARAEKLGIWSDAMEADRQAEGLP